MIKFKQLDSEFYLHVGSVVDICMRLDEPLQGLFNKTITDI